MSGFFYYLTTALDSGLSVFGIRAPYEQPRYEVIATLPDRVDIRAYPARTAVETAMDESSQGEAFGKLFRYITGANHGSRKIAMTVPVEQGPRKIAMTIPVDMSAGRIMRFFLPDAVVQAGPPIPDDPTVHIVRLPAADFAAIRFSGVLNDGVRAAETDKLAHVIAASAWRAQGETSVLSYDPPFAIPFLRRNEIAVAVVRRAG